MPKRSQKSPTTHLEPVRVFISYAYAPTEQNGDDHRDAVYHFATFLRDLGFDAVIDLHAVNQRQDWPQWMEQQVHDSDFVLVVASPAYKRRADNHAEPDGGRGVRYEASLLREALYADREKWQPKVLPILLPGASANDIPNFLQPFSTSRYEVKEFTLEGAEELVRILSRQPAYIASPLGTTPKLPVRMPLSHHSITIQNRENGKEITRRLNDSDRAQNLSSLAKDIIRILVDAIGVDESELAVSSSPTGRRITLQSKSVAFIVRPDLDVTITRNAGSSLIVLTDGKNWQLHADIDGRMRHLTTTVLNLAFPGELFAWLEEILDIETQVVPSPREIKCRLGASSPFYTINIAKLRAVYQRHKKKSTVKVKRNLWAKLLTTALGTNFRDEDNLFVDHTLLVIMAEVIAHAVVGIPPDDPSTGPVTIVTGELFFEAQISGAVEPDFFDWIVEIPEGQQFVKNIARHLARFTWQDVDHDVMKILYQSIISPETRHRLGEYYTPDWLAEMIITEHVPTPLTKHVHDASCGSGTFLFHAIRHYISAAEKAGYPKDKIINGVTTHISGVDVHPVAVTLARVTYLLAIGMNRLTSKSRPSFSVPVFLGDSMRWGQEAPLLSYQGLSIPTADDHEMFVTPPDFTDGPNSEQHLKFPESVVKDAEFFGRFVNELAMLANNRSHRDPIPSLTSTFRRFRIDTNDRPVIRQTFSLMCELHDKERDHIWGYYIRNIAYPLWLSRQENRVDTLIGNPPWLAYRYMTPPQQLSFRQMSVERSLWSGASVAPNQDLAALFVVRCIERYLKPEGEFAFVMPLATLSRKQYTGFRAGEYSSLSESTRVAFTRPWDLHLIKPSFFPVPAAVVFGKRLTDSSLPLPLDQAAEVWSGRFNSSTASAAGAQSVISRTIGESAPPKGERSPYAEHFLQGATIVPRFMFFVEDDRSRPLGTGAGRRALRSRRGAREKQPWKGLKSLHGVVEEQCVWPTYLGDSVLPFRLLAPLEAVLPWDRDTAKFISEDDRELYPGLTRWWRSAEELWDRNRSSDRLSLLERIDYRRTLSQQFRNSRYRVVFTKSGMYLASAVVSNIQGIIDHKLYWSATKSLAEARYLTAIFNSNALTNAVRHLQARGEHNPRDFDKYIFGFSIPKYNPQDSAHKWLTTFAEHAEQVAGRVHLPSIRFESQRRLIREALTADGVVADIDDVVKSIIL